jgi:type IV secretion system protein VirD4
MKPRHIIAIVVIALWLGGGAWASRYLAGGIFMAMHKADPMQVEATTWQEYWASYKDDPKEKKKLQGSAGIAIFLLFGVPLFIFAVTRSKSRSLHGDARWATHSEIEKAGLLEDTGLILGKFGGKFLMMNAAKFILLIAPTRSGKGVGTIIPNLLNWGQSVIVVDIKGENFDVTSGFRAKHGQKVFKFAPFDEKFETHGWNPLSYVNRDPRFVVGELQSIGYMLFPKKEGDSAFWNDAARNLFVAVALYCIECNLSLTVGEVLRRSNGGGRPKEFWQGVVDAAVTTSGEPLSEDCLNSLRQFVGNSDNTLTSILSTFAAPLGVFANPVVDAATSKDDFDLRDIRRQRMSIYVVVPPNRLSEASLLVNLFFSIAIDQNTKVLPQSDPSLKYLALLLLDEFPALGRVDKYVKSVGYIAGYGLRALTIAQSISQLKDRELYGEEGSRTLVTNHMIQIMYAPREQKDATECSEILGYTTQSSVSKGTSHGRGPGSSSRSENTSDQKRALMLPQELREIGPDRIIVLSDDCKPIFADKIKYYTDAAFTKRLLPPVVIPALDVDTFIAKKENRTRPLRPDEIVSADKLDLDMSTMPIVADKNNLAPDEVTAMADWLFSNVKWVDEDDATAQEPAPSDDADDFDEIEEFDDAIYLEET